MTERVPAFMIDREAGLIMRGIAILLVLLGHTGYVEWGGAGGVVLFLILSGYGIECSCREKGLAGYWQRRFRKVWLPYVPVGIISLIVMRNSSPDAVFCSILGLDCNRMADPTLWFVSYILFWYGAYYLSTLCGQHVENKKAFMVIKFVGLMIAAFVCKVLFRTGFVWHDYSGADNYVLCFPFGVLLAWLSECRVPEPPRRFCWSTVLFLCLVYMMRVYPRSAHLPTMMTMGFLPVAISQCFSLGNYPFRMLRLFGKYAYPIYLFEGMVLIKRSSWFAPLEAKQLIDLAYMACSVFLAVLYRNGICRRWAGSLIPHGEGTDLTVTVPGEEP